LDVLGVDVEGLEDGKVDLTNFGAGAWNNEVLVESRESELASAGRKEGQGAGDFAEQAAIEAVLLAFLANNGNNATDHTIISISGEEGCDILKGAKDDIGEGGCQSDRGVEVRDGEVVLAGLDWARAKVGGASVGVESVELFLRLHSSESGDDAVALVGVDDLEVSRALALVIQISPLTFTPAPNLVSSTVSMMFGEHASRPSFFNYQLP
jgi:hypothetical protein